MSIRSLSSLFALENPRPTKKEILITLAACAGCLILLKLDVPCLLHHFFPVPGPGCGISRAWISALHFHFREAFSFHPMFWSVPILYGYVLRQCRVFRNQVVNWWILSLILLGWAANYICTLVEFFRLM